MLQWTAASPHRTLQLFVHHSDGDREYAYDRDPVLGSGTEQIQAAATDHKWTVIDMAAIHPPTPNPALGISAPRHFICAPVRLAVLPRARRTADPR
jgi:hypothetical protein